MNPQEYQAAKALVTKADAYYDAHADTGRGGWRSLDTKKFPEYPDVNKEKGQVEAYEFEHNNTGADGYFCYWKDADATHPRATLTTWMGDKIAEVIHYSQPFRCGFGMNSRRISFQARGTDGHTYAGTYYVSSGNYCRMKRIKVKQ
jgi:hypothetical protein